MPNVLLVEDEGLVARTLKIFVELNAGCHVVAIADDLETALRAVETQPVDVALVDIGLARHASGFAVASELSARGVDCIFVTGSVPPFPIPEFACGCIAKPFTAASIAEALWTAPSRSTSSCWHARSKATSEGFKPYPARAPARQGIDPRL